jgi:hypothetical protein
MHTKKLVYKFEGETSWYPVASEAEGVKAFHEEMGPRYDLVGVVDMTPVELDEYKKNRVGW